MSIKIGFFIVIGLTITVGCTQQEKKTVSKSTAASKKTVLMEPFRFHKVIESAPGNDFDVVSWGRGSSETGAFIILHSDSASMQYTTTTGDLDGTIVDVYNSDMDVDGNPEILIQAKTKDTTNYTKIYAFEFNGSKAQKLDFPKLTKSQRKGYRGGDNFYISEGKLMRSFPVYDGSGKDAKATGQKRLLEYGLRSNEFTVKQLSKDSTEVSPGRENAVADKVVSNTEPGKKQSHTKRSIKHKSSKKRKSSKHTLHKKSRKKKHHRRRE